MDGKRFIKDKYLLALILAAAAFLRFYHIDFQSVWLDEIHTLNVADPSQSLSGLYRSLNTTDPHPPLYFFLVYLCFKLFGYTALVLRMLSAVFGVAGVYALYVLGKDMYNKNTGLIAAVLAAVNFFQIYYAQEGRMYSLLFLTTTLSFIYLVRFIRNPGWKAALLYCLFSTLMIYSHLFAVFTMIAQFAVLLFFIIRPYRTTGKQMLGYTVVSGLISIVLYIPVLLIIMRNTGRKSIWIPLPARDFIVSYFMEFFGWSHIQVYGALIFLILYFARLFSQKKKEGSHYFDPGERRMTFSFLVFASWILLTVFIPLTLSYLVLPMMVSRYFINILPAILLMLAAGLNFIRLDKLKYTLLLAFVFFSLQGLFLKRHYYTTYTKSQFREVSQYIREKDPQRDPVISSLGWYYRYFFPASEHHAAVTEQSLQSYVGGIMQDPSRIRSFWYADAHGNILKLDEKGKQFLQQHFTVTENADFLDAWAKHYTVNK